jgi:outer membrane protein assembly factor BamB
MLQDVFRFIVFPSARYPMAPNYAPNGNEPSSPAIAEGVVYVNSFDFNLYAFNATTGQIIGNFTIMQPDIDFLARFSSPAVANGMVYVGIDGTLYAVSVSFFSIIKSPNDSIFEIITVAVAMVVIVMPSLVYVRNRKITACARKNIK